MYFFGCRISSTIGFFLVVEGGKKKNALFGEPKPMKHQKYFVNLIQAKLFFNNHLPRM